MSILIKDMQAPKNCSECECHNQELRTYFGGGCDWKYSCKLTGTKDIKDAESKRADDCPIEEVLLSSIGTSTEVPKKDFKIIETITLSDDWIEKLAKAIAKNSEKGEWLEAINSDYAGGGYSECSICGMRYSWDAVFNINMFRYCPRCGHRMNDYHED